MGLSCISEMNGEPPLELPPNSLDLTNSLWTSSNHWFTSRSYTFRESVESRIECSALGVYGWSLGAGKPTFQL
ncbi:hypothetical protein GW17_00048538 [Ensete ventricosum]|nr:hypothetical protein GW17_00048538 [Ensete ventricosum]